MHRTKLSALSLLTTILLAGCVVIRSNDPGASAPDTCGARDFAAMVGTPIAAATFPVGVRTIGPDTIITQDFVPARLNVLIDAGGVIVGFRCG